MDKYMTSSLNCEHCVYWDRIITTDRGKCSRFPPQIIEGYPAARFPETYEDMFCAEYDDNDDTFGHKITSGKLHYDVLEAAKGVIEWFEARSKKSDGDIYYEKLKKAVDRIGIK